MLRSPALLVAAVAALLVHVAYGAPAQPFIGLKEVNPPAEPPADRQLAIVGAILVDGRGGPPVEDSVVIIHGSRIAAAGPRDAITIPKAAEVIDAAGLTLLPGLIDTHFHLGDGAKKDDIPPLFLSHGVTTARDPGRPIEVYDAIRSSIQPMPRLFLTGPHFDQAPPAYPENAVLLATPEAAREAVDRYVAQGASAIKVYYRLPTEHVRATCEQAHGHKIPVTAHLELVDATAAIEAGLDGIEHVTSFGTSLAEPAAAEQFRRAVDAENEARREQRYRLWADLDLVNSPRLKPLLDLIEKRDVFVSPTLAVFEKRDGDKGASYHHVRGFEKMLRFVGLCHEAGIDITTGSHTWVGHAEFGWAYQREMELLVESGLTPLEAITASTLNGARFLGCQDRLGTIEPNRLADVVLVAGKPHEGIRAMYDVRHVMLNGEWIGAAPESSAAIDAESSSRKE